MTPSRPSPFVLVTGASGVLGRWLLRTAPDGVEPVALVHRSPLPPTEGGPVRTVQADLRDAEAAADAVAEVQPDVVLHAAYAVDDASIVAATANVVAASASVGATVLLTSTDAVFSGDGTSRDETDRPDPVADYGRWKLAAERLVLAADRPDRSGSDGVVVRLPLLVSFDPDDHVTARLRSAAAAGESTPWFTDEIRRPALAAEVAAALWRIVALDPAERAGCWHLAGPERLSRHEIASRVVDRFGLPATSITGGPTPPGTTRPRDLELTDRRARRLIGWDPAPVR